MVYQQKSALYFKGLFKNRKSKKEIISHAKESGAYQEEWEGIPAGVRTWSSTNVSYEGGGKGSLGYLSPRKYVRAVRKSGSDPIVITNTPRGSKFVSESQGEIGTRMQIQPKVKKQKSPKIKTPKSKYRIGKGGTQKKFKGWKPK
jgi:hypothetical protein